MCKVVFSQTWKTLSMTNVLWHLKLSIFKPLLRCTIVFHNRHFHINGWQLDKTSYLITFNNIFNFNFPLFLCWIGSWNIVWGENFIVTLAMFYFVSTRLSNRRQTRIITNKCWREFNVLRVVIQNNVCKATSHYVTFWHIRTYI